MWGEDVASGTAGLSTAFGGLVSLRLSLVEDLSFPANTPLSPLFVRLFC
jgi:hypothetical protein